MSPIRGLTDTVMPAFPRLGKLFKGAEATRNASGQVVKIGQDLSYFRFVSERPEVAEAFADAYGQEPTLINAYLPYAKVEDNFSCWKEAWAAGGLKHRCDGEIMTIWLKPDGQYSKEPKPCEGGCDEVGRLSLIIPELVRAGYVGYVIQQTHGINDLLSIQASLMAAADARVGNELGLRGIQWTLRRVKEKISTPLGNGKRGRRDKWLVKLEPAADWVQLQLQAAHNATMMLPAPTGETKPFDRVNDRNVDQDTGEIITSTAREIEPQEAVEGEVVVEQAQAAVAPPSPAPQATPEVKPNGKAHKAWTKEELEPRIKALWDDAKKLEIPDEQLPAINYEGDSAAKLIESGKQLTTVVKKAIEAQWSELWVEVVILQLDTSRLPMLKPQTQNVEEMKASLAVLNEAVEALKGKQELFG